VSAGNSAEAIAPRREETVTAGSGVADACHNAAAAPISMSTPSGRALRANTPVATATSARAA